MDQIPLLQHIPPDDKRGFDEMQKYLEHQAFFSCLMFFYLFIIK